MTHAEYARWCALQLAPLWNMPEETRAYLESGNEKQRRRAGKLAEEAGNRLTYNTPEHHAAWTAAFACFERDAESAARYASDEPGNWTRFWNLVDPNRERRNANAPRS